MSGDVLLDTSSIVAHWRSPLPELIASEGELFLPLIALGELHAPMRAVLYGAIHAEAV